MNLVGKIFVVLIFVMSLVWMGFAVAVYAAHKNWREAVEGTAEAPEEGLKFKVEREKERNQELKDQRDKLTNELAAEKAAKRQALTKLETENDELRRQRDEQEKRLADLVQAQTDAMAALEATQAAEAALRAEIMGGEVDGKKLVGLREQIRLAQEDRDRQFDEVVKLTDELHQARNEYQALKERTATLTADLADAKAVLEKHGLKPIPALYEGIPPQVDGVVEKVGASGLVEISLGSDDGLIKGHTLHVVRQGGHYLGRVEVTETAPDKAVCKVLSEFAQGPIQRGDRVYSKLRQ